MLFPAEIFHFGTPQTILVVSKSDKQTKKSPLLFPFLIFLPFHNFFALHFLFPVGQQNFPVPPPTTGYGPEFYCQDESRMDSSLVMSESFLIRKKSNISNPIILPPILKTLSPN